MNPRPFDRARILRRAHENFRVWRNLGAPRPFAQCLRAAWSEAKRARAAKACPRRRAAARRPFPQTPAFSRAA